MKDEGGMSDQHVVEKLMYDGQGNEIFKAIEQRYIELRLKGFNVTFCEKFIKHFKQIGMNVIASGMTPEGTHWYRLDINRSDDRG